MGIFPNRFWGEKEAHAILVGNFKPQDDLKMYGQLPDYDEFHGYDLEIDSELSQIAGNIYANSRIQSWETSKRHLFLVGIPKQL